MTMSTLSWTIIKLKRDATLWSLLQRLENVSSGFFFFLIYQQLGLGEANAAFKSCLISL